jgi:hypothetical protein
VEDSKDNTLIFSADFEDGERREMLASELIKQLRQEEA